MDRLACVDLPGPVDAARILEALRAFSPDVEPYAEDPGAFFVSGAGLAGLFPSAAAWGRAIAASLRADGPRVVVGFTRFGSYAVAKQGAPFVAFRSAEAERRAAHAVPLARLGLEPKLLRFLHDLGLSTVGDYLTLPPRGLRLRFGVEAERLHRVASGTLYDPLRPAAVEAPVMARVSLDEHPEGDTARLLFVIKAALGPLLAQLAARAEALTHLYIELCLERAEPQHELVEPAEPTLDEARLLRLVHLRLESAPPRAPVLELCLRVASTRAAAAQLELFHSMQRRDLRAAAEALADLRADLGADAVCKAVLRDGHLPEAQFALEPIGALSAARAPLEAQRVLVRRLYARPRPLDARPHAVDVHGPYLVSGGWWRGELARDYLFVETAQGALLWLYYDRRRARWFLHGRVE